MIRRRNAKNRGKFGLFAHARALVRTWADARMELELETRQNSIELERSEKKKKNSSSLSLPRQLRKTATARTKRTTAAEIKVARQLLRRKTQRRGALGVVCSQAINRIETRGIARIEFPIESPSENECSELIVNQKTRFATLARSSRKISKRFFAFSRATWNSRLALAALFATRYASRLSNFRTWRI